MSKSKERRFKIDVFTPETIPMERLAQYMLQFAKLLGEPERVHFVDVESGSAVLRARVEDVAIPKVERRITDASRGQGDVVALKALQSLDDMLAEDNAVGQLCDDVGAEIIAFPGRNRAKPLEYGPFREEGVLDLASGRGSGLQKLHRPPRARSEACQALRRRPPTRHRQRQLDSPRQWRLANAVV